MEGQRYGEAAEICRNWLSAEPYSDTASQMLMRILVAMGNAQPAVKEAADYIAPTNDEDGLVDVISRFFEQ